MVVLICSQLRPGENIAYEEQKGIFPMVLKPDAVVTNLCSATPTCMNRAGNLSANKCILVDSVRSAESPTTFLFSSPAWSSPLPKPFRIGTCSTSGLNNLGFNFSFGFNILDWSMCFKFGKRLLGFFFRGRFPVPFIIAFHKAHAFAGYSVGNNHCRLFKNP